MLKLTKYMNFVIGGAEQSDVQHEVFDNKDELCTYLGKELTPQIKKMIFNDEFPIIFLVRNDGYPLPMCVISYKIDINS